MLAPRPDVRDCGTTSPSSAATSQAVGASLPAARIRGFPRRSARALRALASPPRRWTGARRPRPSSLSTTSTRTLAEELERLEPHGAGNPRPGLSGARRARGRPWRRSPTGASAAGSRAGAAICVRRLAPGRDEPFGSTASGGPFDIHYRISDGRDWGLQAEVLAAGEALRVKVRRLELAVLVSRGGLPGRPRGFVPAGPPARARRRVRRPPPAPEASGEPTTLLDGFDFTEIGRRANRCCASRPSARSGTDRGRACRRTCTPARR